MEISKAGKLPDLRVHLDRALANFITGENGYLTAIGPELDPVASALQRFLLDSGKRLRPLFALVGYIGTGNELNPEVIRAAASLELIHVCALIHDDVMDASDTRRGAPAIHKAFETLHGDQKLMGSSSQFGLSSAILLGDLALIWSAKMLHQSGLDGELLVKVLPWYDEMRIELMAGQYLDVYEQAMATGSVERSLRVARFKSGKYTIERPLHIGASMAADVKTELFTQYSQYGLPLGEAFQIRDDVLGVFGDPAQTGKPAGDDLREGKRTALMAVTFEKASASQRQQLDKLFGDPELELTGVNVLQEIIRDTGALEHIENLIDSLTSQALAATENNVIAPVGRELMQQMAEIAIRRTI